MVHPIMPLFKRRTVVSDLALGLTVTIVLVTALVSLLYYISSTSNAEKLLEQQAADHVDRLASILATPLLKGDDATTIRSAIDYRRLHNIDMVRVFDKDGEALIDPVGNEESLHVMSKKSVDWYGHLVGTVEISLNRTEIIKAQQTTLRLTLTIMISVILAVVTASWFFLKAFVTRPLSTISEGIDVIADGSYEHVMPPVHRRDIDVIIDKINIMASHIAARDKQLHDLIKELEKSRDDLQNSLQETVRSLASTTEKRDPYTSGHQERVNRLAIAIAKEQGLSDQQIAGLHIAALLHDIGKIALPAEYLAKPSLLSKIERAAIEHHAEVGYDILKNINFPWPVAEIVYQHHEHLDGSGYPRGLTDNEIHLEAKILAVADVVEAMSSHRPYRPSLGVSAALDQIRAGRGTHYHPESVDACLRLINDKVEFYSKDWCPIFTRHLNRP